MDLTTERTADLPVAVRRQLVDEATAKRLLRVHVPQPWPAGLYCANCRGRHPCRMHRWARAVLRSLGWTEAATEALDPRTGPWS